MLVYALLAWSISGISVGGADDSAATPPPPQPGTLLKIEGGRLHFQGYEPIQTSWRDIQFVGLIPSPTPDGAPYALLIAKPCQDCLEERSVQMLRVDGSRRMRFALPGKVQDPKTGTVIVDNRGFYGACLPGVEPGFVSFQKDIVDKKKWKRRYRSTEPSYLVVEPLADGTVREKLSELRSLGQLAAKERQALQAVKQKKCFEVPGQDRRISAKLMNIRPPREDEVDDDEDAESEKTSEKAAKNATELPGAPDTQPAEPSAAELGVPTLSSGPPVAGPSPAPKLTAPPYRR